MQFEDSANNDLGSYNPSGSSANYKKEESFYELPIGTQAIFLSISHDPQEVFDSYSDGIYGIDLKFHQRVLPEMNQTLGAKVTYATSSAAEVFYSDENWQKTMLDKIPMKRFGKMEDLHGITILLASDASSYITGQIFYIDGGFISSI